MRWCSTSKMSAFARIRIYRRWASRCRRLPKRGFNNIFGKDVAIVNLGMIQKLIDAKKLDAKAVIDHAAPKAAGGAGRGAVQRLGHLALHFGKPPLHHLQHCGLADGLSLADVMQPPRQPLLPVAKVLQA